MAYQTYQAIPTQREARGGSLALPVMLLFLGGILSIVAPLAMYRDIRERMAFDSGTSEVDAEVTDVTKWPGKYDDEYEVKYRFDAALFDRPPSIFHGRGLVSVIEQRRHNYRRGGRASVIYATQHPTLSRLKAEGPPKTDGFAWWGMMMVAGLALLYFARAVRRDKLRDINLAKELDEAGVITTGRVKSFVYVGTRYASYRLTYEFVEEWAVEQSVWRKSDLSEGQEVRVRYLERDPRISRCE